MKKLIIVLSLLLGACAGPQGVDGKKGDAGVPGAPGHDGFNSSSGSVVQLCASELGLCVDNRLYAIYGKGHDNSLKELVAGSYNKNDTGLSCSFVVVNKCIVQ